MSEAQKVEDVAVEKDAAKVDPTIKQNKELLLKELANWKEFFDKLEKACLESPDDVYTDALYKAQHLITACDKEVVYMNKLEEVIKERLNAKSGD